MEITATALDVKAFRRDGYVRVPGALDEGRMAELDGWVREIEAWPADSGGWLQHDELGECGVVRTRTENFSPYHEGLRALLTGGALPAMAAALLGGPAVLYKEKVNYKYPGGAGFAAHQDAPAYPDVPVSVSCLVALDPATEANGCLELAAGLHGGLLPTDGDGCLPTDLAAGLDWRAEPLAAGSLLWFHSHTPHRSGGNGTDRSRRALYLTYNTADLGDFHDRYYARKREALARRAADGVSRVSLIGHFRGRSPDTAALPPPIADAAVPPPSSLPVGSFHDRKPTDDELGGGEGGR